MIENILIVDTETTGLMPDKGDKVIEIAAVLFNLKHRTVLQSFATLYPCETNPVERINHIKAEATQCKYPFVRNPYKEELLDDVWKNPQEASTLIYQEVILVDTIMIEMLHAAQACVAHNAEFDKKFVKTLAYGNAFLNKRWICTKAHFTWPIPLNRFRLEDICNAMKVPYDNPHRALTDCLLLAQCFEKIEDLESRFNRC